MDIPYHIPNDVPNVPVRDYTLFDYTPRDLGFHTESKNISNASKIMAAMFAMAHAADWAQTLHIARNPDKYYEKDMERVIGAHPSTGKVNGFMAIEGLLKGLGPFLLSPGYREATQAATIGGKMKVIDQNRKIGIGLKF